MALLPEHGYGLWVKKHNGKSWEAGQSTKPPPQIPQNSKHNLKQSPQNQQIPKNQQGIPWQVKKSLFAQMSKERQRAVHELLKWVRGARRCVSGVGWGGGEWYFGKRKHMGVLGK